jgi:hypothetical protein
MAHQTHSLSWNLLAKHFKYQPAIPHKLTSLKPDIVPLQKESQAADLTYFARGIAKTIEEFSTQLRSRNPPKEHYVAIAKKWMQSDGEEDEPGSKGRKVYSDEIKEKYSDDDTISTRYSYKGDYQDVAEWIEMASPNHVGRLAYYAGYDEIELPFVIKILIREASGVLEGKPRLKAKQNDPVPKEEVEEACDEAMEILLLLANHPQIPLWSIKSCGQTYSRGIDTIAKSCLRLYLMLNLLITMKEAGSPLEEEMDWDSPRPRPEGFRKEKRYTQCEKYNRMVQNCTWDLDHCATRGLHGKFFNLQTTRNGNYITETRDLDILADMDACQEYLKKLWRIMVVYDLIIREEGDDPDWVEEVFCLFRMEYGIPSEINWDTDQKITLLSADEKKKSKR